MKLILKEDVSGLGYKAEDGAGSAGLCADGELKAGELSCESFGVGFDFGEPQYASTRK